MKLSKAQQRVVEKLQLGWTLYQISDCGTESYLKESNDNVFQVTGTRIDNGTVRVLLHKGVICADPVGRNDHWVRVFKLMGS